jgi:hypothetical protein
MRRIENMKTLSIHRAALDSTARYIGSTQTVRPEFQQQPVVATHSAIERQLDEIQHTFSARWEW